MACISQSIARYTLLRCIVSAAQFAGGDLCFYENYAELVAQDAVGETTTPLRIDYDVLLHFRVVRQQQLMRIELPRLIVWRWAEANRFASELDGGEILTREDMNRPCTLIEQLREEDMTHFLQSVAPMVAASRRARSASRISTTEPLPLSYFPPNPEANSVAATETPSDADGDNVNLSGGSQENNDRDGGMDDSSENVSAAWRSQSTTPTTLHNPSPGVGADSVESAGDKSNASRKKKHVNVAPVTATTASAVSAAVVSEERGEKGEEDRLSHCLEALGAAADTSAVHLTRGISSQSSPLLATFTARKRGRGAATCGGSSEAVMTNTPPPPSLSSTELRVSRQLRGKGNTQRSAATRRRPPHVGIDGEEEPGTMPKRARKDKSPTLFSLPAGATMGDADAATRTTARVPPVEPPGSGVSPEQPIEKPNAVIQSPAGELPPSTRSDVVSVHCGATTAVKRDATDPNMTAEAAYNFADLMTAPENAAHLPLFPEVKKILGELEEMILPKRRRRGAGKTKTPRPPPKKGTAGKKQRKVTAKRPGGGNEEISEEQATAAKAECSTAPQKLQLMADEGDGALTPPAVAAADVVVSPPANSPAIMKPSYPSQHGSFIQAPVLPSPQKSEQTSARDCPELGHTSDGAAAEAVTRCFPSPCVTPMSDYHLAETVSNQHREENGEINMDAGSGPETSAYAAPAATAASTPPSRKAIPLEQKMDGQLTSTPLGPHKPLPFAHDAPPLCHCQQRCMRHYGTLSALVEGDSRKSRWRRVVRQLNSLSLHLTKARACGEELRGLFLLLLEDAEI
ncbi:hypothetical protein MOQ_000158 [Trypanosoma cruzi marinkellei]|uniref:Uncharacterized protein n=1 Tax=Trypanosoma cruzi marinkellei TaxID=85056 RepID=K2NP65_TRYCR|nr:hypothetical protein MOQ_000158 [Trypanosoma cruzi marinkellei]